MDEPRAMVNRRPIQSLTYAAGMKVGSPPRLIPAMMRPRMLGLTSPMSSLPVILIRTASTSYMETLTLWNDQEAIHETSVKSCFELANWFVEHHMTRFRVGSYEMTGMDKTKSC